MERDLRLQYDLLVAPVAHALPADPEELVTFIPSGPLIVTPFAALTDGDGKRFVERHTIAVAPSLQTLLLTRNLHPGRRSGALVVGNPNRPGLRMLPGARREAETLAERFGLSRAFLLAGVPRVIATLWPIDDTSTPILMGDFYGHFDARGAAGALRHAMLSTIAAGYPEPRHWAAFALIGHR